MSYYQSNRQKILQKSKKRYCKEKAAKYLKTRSNKGKVKESILTLVKIRKRQH